MNNHPRIAILGGGISGVTVASELAKNGLFRIELLEKEHRLGGLHHSVAIDGVAYDIGAFVFARDHEIFQIFPTLRDFFVVVPHLSMTLTPSFAFDRYPMTLRSYVRDNGVTSAALAGLDILTSKILHRRRTTLSSFIKYYVGDTIYNRSGLKAYVERFYCTSDEEIDIEFAGQRLGVLRDSCSFRKNAVRVVREIFDSGAVTRPWECCVRPPEGFEPVYAEIRRVLESRGVTVTTGCEVRGIVREGEKFLVDFGDRVERYDRVISTIPIPAVSGYLGLPAAREIEHMTLLTLFYRFSGEPGFHSSLLYNFTLGGAWKRLMLFSNYYGTHDGEHYFAVECTQHENDTHTLEDQRRLFEEHVATLPIFRGTLRYQGGTVTERAYPFYRRGVIERIKAAKERLTAAGIDLAGRQGRFDYITSHVVASRSRALAEQLSAGAR